MKVGTQGGVSARRGVIGNLVSNDGHMFYHYEMKMDLF